MNTVEKRDFIHSHLHRVDEDLLNEMFRKVYSKIGEEITVGYEPDGTPISKAQFIADIKEAEKQIERGEYLTIEELEKESEQW